MFFFCKALISFGLRPISCNQRARTKIHDRMAEMHDKLSKHIENHQFSPVPPPFLRKND